MQASGSFLFDHICFFAYFIFSICCSIINAHDWTMVGSFETTEPQVWTLLVVVYDNKHAISVQQKKKGRMASCSTSFTRACIPCLITIRPSLGRLNHYCVSTFCIKCWLGCDMMVKQFQKILCILKTVGRYKFCKACSTYEGQICWPEWNGHNQYTVTMLRR